MKESIDRTSVFERISALQDARRAGPEAFQRAVEVVRESGRLIGAAGPEDAATTWPRVPPDADLG